ncbi:MAG: slipin family protein [Gammaproteobacteria bacterium]|nr:slipin family protein [Gammaproteobacteria bacterium]
MFFVKQFDIADNEMAFLFKQNRFAAVLEPGRYRYLDLLGNIRAERFDITHHELEHGLNKFLVSACAEQTQDYLEAHQLNDHQVGLCYLDGQLVDIVAPGSFKVYWKGPERVELKRIDISDEVQIAKELLILLGRAHNPRVQRAAAQAVYYTEVADNHVGILLVNGKLEEMLPPGCYGFWKYHRSVVVKHMDLRLQNIEISGQEILTKDRVSLRLNLSAAYRIRDPLLVQSKLADFNDYLYREFQLQLREAVGTRTLDQLLNDKDALNTLISDGIGLRVKEYGIEVMGVGVRDIILPGDMKVILNQVVEAEKAAEANLIKRREETAATRSLHNTAKVMEGNPTLMRLKELEVLEKVTERIGNITVYSGLEGVLKDLVKVSPSAT